MCVAAIIAEYNPLHNGHLHQIRHLKDQGIADFVLVIMSGNFVQRGEPAIFDKYTRTRMALVAGADLVLELPFAWSTSSAREFAFGAVSILNQLHVVDLLCFGSESGHLEDFSQAASIIEAEPEAYQNLLKSMLKSGSSYPKARASAMQKLYGIACAETPNDILALEYCLALRHFKSSIIPYTIKRLGSNYHEKELCSGVFASASAIRDLLRSSGNLTEAALHVPDAVSTMLGETIPVFTDDFSLLLNQRLLELSRQQVPLTEFADVSDEIAARLGSQLLQFDSWENRISALKTKQYTYTRISRALLHIATGLKKEHLEQYKTYGYAAYARILGFCTFSSDLLSKVKLQSSIPLISKTADAGHILDSTAYEMFSQDVFCAHLYQSVLQDKSGIRPKNEYTTSPIRFDGTDWKA